jgi:hypothetical protein
VSEFTKFLRAGGENLREDNPYLSVDLNRELDGGINLERGFE